MTIAGSVTDNLAIPIQNCKSATGQPLPKDLIGFLSEIHAAGVDLFLHQQGLDTTMPAGKALFQMMGVFAEFERSMIQERVRAGLRRAKEEGQQLGRPRIPVALEKDSRPRRRGAQDSEALRRRSKHGAADQPPFRRRKPRWRRIGLRGFGGTS
jgi:DNA invertase Pin-like site-specific DNA recombinase